MELQIGRVIKELRGRNKVTQEQLAEYMGVTAQSVSKWEAGVNLPDITMLSGLAAYFGVTADYLLHGEQAAGKDEADILKEAGECRSRGDRDGAVRILTEGVNRYPRNYEIMLEYVSSIYEVRRKEDYKDRVEGAMQYSRRIIAESGDSRLVYRAKHLLCMFYCGTDREKAREIAESLPSMPVCQDLLMEKILEGEELEIQKDTNLEHFLFYLWCRLQALVNTKKQKLTVGERIIACTTGAKLWEMFCYDGRLGLYNSYVARNYVDMTRLYAEQGGREDALACMERAAEHIRLFRESCDRDEILTESVFWYDKNMAKGSLKKESIDDLAGELTGILEGELGRLLSKEEAREAGRRLEKAFK